MGADVSGRRTWRPASGLSRLTSVTSWHAMDVASRVQHRSLPGLGRGACVVHVLRAFDVRQGMAILGPPPGAVCAIPDRASVGLVVERHRRRAFQVGGGAAARFSGRAGCGVENFCGRLSFAPSVEVKQILQGGTQGGTSAN